MSKRFGKSRAPISSSGWPCKLPISGQQGTLYGKKCQADNRKVEGSNLSPATFSLVAQPQFRQRFRLLGIKASLRERPTIGFRSVRRREQLRLGRSIRVCSK